MAELATLGDLTRERHRHRALTEDLDYVIAKALKRAKPAQPVILMTAYGTPELQEQASAIGVRHVLLKPFDLQQVVALVRTALQAGGSEP